MVTLAEGVWNARTSYEVLTAVYHDGDGYISRRDNIGVEPGTDDSVWYRIVKQGTIPNITFDEDGNMYADDVLVTTVFADVIERSREAVENVEQWSQIGDTMVEEEMRRRHQEDERIAAENERVLNERNRRTAEENRARNESSRESNENSRELAESARETRFEEAMQQAASTMRKGDPGKSAYEVAVDNGFEGTEEQWLTALTGPAGDSTYAIAVQQGFVGTKDQWLASLVGPQGKSAYQVAVDAGFEGTISEWLLSLKGAKGDIGDTGRQGPKGDKGDQGNTGSSVEYPFELVNNLTTDDATKAATAAMAKALQDGKASVPILDYTDVEHTVTTGIVTTTGAATTSNNWNRFIFPNKGYSRIKVKAYTSTSYMAIAFYNSEEWGASSFMQSASVVGRNYTQSYDVVVPEGCKTIIVCNNKSQRALPEITLYLMDISSDLKTINENVEKIDDLYKVLSLENADEVIAGYTIFVSNGALTTSASQKVFLFRNYDYTKIEALLGANTATFAAIAFYNADTPSADSFISGVASNNSSATNYSADIPAGCKLIAIAAKVDLVTPTATIYLNKTKSISDKMDARYNEVKEKIGDRTDIVSLNNPVQMPHILQQMKFTGGIGSPSSLKPLVLLHFSDIHGGNSETHGVNNKKALERILEFKNAYAPYIDDILCTGDQPYQDITDRQDANNTENWWDAVDGSEKILPVVGNHDSWASGSEVNGSAGLATTYAALFNNISECSPTNHPEGKCYYYKDYDTQGIRLIIVDPYYSDSDEETWFASALNSALYSGLAVIIAIHPPFYDYTPLKCTFNSLKFNGTFQNHVPTANYISMVDSFMENGGKLICWLTGHVHADVVGYCGTTRRQLMVGAPSAKAPRSASTSAETNNVDIRVLGTKSEDSFNIFSCETEYKTITVMRIGSDYDVALRHRGILAINYETMEVLYNN